MISTENCQANASFDPCGRFAPVRDYQSRSNTALSRLARRHLLPELLTSQMDVRCYPRRKSWPMVDHRRATEAYRGLLQTAR